MGLRGSEGALAWLVIRPSTLPAAPASVGRPADRQERRLGVTARARSARQRSRRDRGEVRVVQARTARGAHRMPGHLKGPALADVHDDDLLILATHARAAPHRATVFGEQPAGSAASR